MISKLNLNKQYVLIAGAILLLVMTYQFAFKRTLESWRLHNELQSKLTTSTGLTSQPAYLERKDRNLDHILHRYNVDTSNFRSNVLGTITSIAQQEDVTLSEVPLEDPSSHSAGCLTERIRFAGGYFALVKTLKRLQSTTGIGVIRCAAIKTDHKEQNQSGKSKPLMDVYLMIVR